jgi:hypothetical protein
MKDVNDYSVMHNGTLVRSYHGVLCERILAVKSLCITNLHTVPYVTFSKLVSLLNHLICEQCCYD